MTLTLGVLLDKLGEQVSQLEFDRNESWTLLELIATKMETTKTGQDFMRIIIETANVGDSESLSIVRGMASVAEKIKNVKKQNKKIAAGQETRDKSSSSPLQQKSSD